MSRFDYPARFVNAGFTLLALVVLAIDANMLGDPCKTDRDCGMNTVCWRYPISPSCQLGTCQCQAQHYKVSSNSYDCFSRIPLMLNSSCSSNELEQYPPGAYCYAGVVKCKVHYQQFFNSCALLPTVQSDYGTHCISDLQCNPEIGLFCNLAWQSCTCYANYVWQGNVCEEAYYGTNCETDDNCQTGGAFSLGGPGGGGTCDAIEHTCTCDRGFSTVNFTQFYLDPSGESLDMVKSTWTVCVVKDMNTIKLGSGEQCTVTAWSSATPISGQRYCKAGLACIICPEAQFQTSNSTSNPNIGTCRNDGEPTVVRRNNFSAAALLILFYQAIKILTTIV